MYLLRITTTKQTPWLWSASELYRPSDRRLSAKLVQTLANRGCRVVSAVNFGFLDRGRYFSIQVAPQLSSRGWVDPVPDPLLLRKSGSSGNRTRNLWICSQELWPLDHRGGLKRRDIHASSGIRTYDSSDQAGKDISCLTPRDHWDQLSLR
jgi:hypothetical protein